MKIPEKTSVEVKGSKVMVTGPTGTLEKEFNPRLVKIESVGDQVTVLPLSKMTRRMTAMVRALESHLRNMFAGSSTLFEKKLSVVYAHFPVTVEVKGDLVMIKNFLGEKTPRTAKIVGKTTVAIKGQDISVSGNDKEAVGQTASNIVKATKIVKKDVRVFQDGIYYAI